MGKKNKRRPFPEASYITNALPPTASATSSFKDTQPEFESYIDHRNQTDLSNLGTTASRVRRRSSHVPVIDRRQTDFPLTNKNLQNLYSNSKSIALDMDAYTQEQHRLSQIPEITHPSTWNNPFDSSNDRINDHSSDVFSNNLYGFGGSNPPSEHSDDSSSLDDVFAPDKEDISGWPDLRVMEEFIREELQELQEIRMEPPSRVQSPFSPKHSNDVANILSPSQSLESPVPRKSYDTISEQDDAPLLNNIQVNEVESLHSEPLRVRPQPIQPWENVPSILKNKKDPTPRFTYFREDLDKTIHSPTISGLIADEEGDTTIERLQSLFSPSYYSVGVSKSPSSVSIGNGLAPFRNNANSTSNTDLDSKPGGATVNFVPPSNHGNTSATGTDIEQSYTPFWLDVLDPTENEMKVISKTFGIHPLTTEDIFLGEAREKVELFKSYYFVCFTSFDIVHERRKQQAKEKEKMILKLQELYDQENARSWWKPSTWIRRDSGSQNRRRSIGNPTKDTQSVKSITRKIRSGELVPLNMYMIVFKEAVITFHFSQTPHPINVRRRARLLRDHITVTPDWISYALIDDVTDSFAPMIESIEDEVNSIEDALFKMQSMDPDSDDSDDSDSEDQSQTGFMLRNRQKAPKENLFVKRPRSKSTVDIGIANATDRILESRAFTKRSFSTSSKSTSSRSTDSKVIRWKRQGDMLRRIGECRKRVMSVLRLLGTKADVVRAFSKRFADNANAKSRSEIAMYLGDIQDHIVTMVQALNHHEQLLARFHSNYLAQINIDMTRVNNSTNDVLGKLTVMGTIVLPLNVVTGLWGMNCLVPGQEYNGLAWFWGIVFCMAMFSFIAFNYAKKVTGL
mgnify:CR=1 FL=1